MVVAAAAAVVVGGYAAVRGGKAAVVAAKGKIKDIKLERRHDEQFAAKKKERSGRLARVEALRTSAANGGNGGIGTAKLRSEVLARFRNKGK